MLFATQEGDWVRDAQKAKDFSDVTQAANFALERGWKETVQLVLVVDTIQVIIPLFGERK